MQIVEHSTKTASIRLVWPFLALARTCKLDVSHIAAALGLTEAEMLDPDTRVPAQRLSDLLGQTIASSGLHELGLLAATCTDSSHFGIFEYMARSRPTLREALSSTVHYLPLLAEGAFGVLSEESDAARVRFWFDPTLVMHESAYEFLVAVAVLHARRTTGLADLTPVAVRFMHAQPANTQRHHSVFGCPIHFNAEATEILLAPSALDLKLPGAEPVLNALLTRAADLMLENLPRSSGVADRIETELTHNFDLGDVTIERLARKLGCSVRTLHRRLHDEGTSYRVLLDRVRATFAMRRLEQSDQPIAEIAHALGFSSPQSFHRSFKRCTGFTAAQYRRRTRGNLEPAHPAPAQRAPVEH